MSRATGYATAVAFIGCIVVANALTSRFGMVAVGAGLTATAGTYAAGLALGLRDAVQECLGRYAVLAVIAIGSVVSFLVADSAIALASFAAFTLAELADLAVYTPLRRRRLILAVLASNIVGGLVDTYVFLELAPFGPVTAEAVAGQMVAKVVWATALPLVLFACFRRWRR